MARRSSLFGLLGLVAAPLLVAQPAHAWAHERDSERDYESRYERESESRHEREHEKAQFVRLVSPLAGSAFEAGRQVELHWVPGPDLEAFEEAHEWEAFLSVDGGATWAFRITPHLDLERRQMSFRAPEVLSDDVRLLLRVGDEVEEREQELAARFRITPPSARWARTPAALPALVRGESAREGELGVLSWVEELEDGRLVEHHFEQSGLVLTAQESGSPLHWVATLDGQRERERDLLAVERTDFSSLPWPVEAGPPSLRLARSLPILLLVQRFNE